MSRPREIWPWRGYMSLGPSGAHVRCVCLGLSQTTDRLGTRAACPTPHRFAPATIPVPLRLHAWLALLNTPNGPVHRPRLPQRRRVALAVDEVEQRVHAAPLRPAAALPLPQVADVEQPHARRARCACEGNPADLRGVRPDHHCDVRGAVVSAMGLRGIPFPNASAGRRSVGPGSWTHAHSYCDLDFRTSYLASNANQQLGKQSCKLN